ncbi:MAG: hypothetical protein IKA72_02705 [Clostridia bacterium]|nr:hypothetical protein [Clostridia bacterium]
MKINITKNKNLLNISFFKIDFQKVKELLILLDIKIVSVFFDKCNKYVFSKSIAINDFSSYLSQINCSTLIFDDEVEKCLIDKEIDLLTNKKILIDYNLGENMTNILVNLKNTKITEEEIKGIFKLTEFSR